VECLGWAARTSVCFGLPFVRRGEIGVGVGVGKTEGRIPVPGKSKGKLVGYNESEPSSVIPSLPQWNGNQAASRKRKRFKAKGCLKRGILGNIRDFGSRLHSGLQTGGVSDIFLLQGSKPRE